MVLKPLLSIIGYFLYYRTDFSTLLLVIYSKKWIYTAPASSSYWKRMEKQNSYISNHFPKNIIIVEGALILYFLCNVQRYGQIN
jgi:hypothetical protein